MRLPSDATPGDLIAALDCVLAECRKLRVINEEDQHALKSVVVFGIENVKGRIRSTFAAVNPRVLVPSREIAEFFGTRTRPRGGRRQIYP